MSRHIFLMYKIAFKEAYVSNEKIIEKCMDDVGQNIDENGYYILKKKNKLKIKKITSSGKTTTYKEVNHDILNIINEYLDNYLKEYKNLNLMHFFKNDEKEEEARNEAPTYIKGVSISQNVKDRTISGFIEIGDSGRKREVVGKDDESGDLKPLYSIKRKQNVINQYFFFIYLPENSNYGFLVCDQVNAESCIRVFKQGFSFYLNRESPYKLKFEANTMYYSAKKKFLPRYKKIVYEKYKNLKPSEVAKGGRGGKKLKLSYRGEYILSDEEITEEDIDSGDLVTVIKDKLGYFYSIPEDKEENVSYKLVVEVNGVERVLNIAKDKTVGMAFDVTDEVVIKSDGSGATLASLRDTAIKKINIFTEANKAK